MSRKREKPPGRELEGPGDLGPWPDFDLGEFTLEGLGDFDLSKIDWPDLDLSELLDLKVERFLQSKGINPQRLRRRSRRRSGGAADRGRS